MKRKFSRRILSSAIMLSMAVNSAAQSHNASEQQRQQQALIRQQISQSNSRPVSNAPVSIELDLAQQASAAALKEASNGTTVVDIAAPSAGGVSHNRFTKFDVDQNGVILNNSLNPVLTQLGGWADGNRRLAGGEANIILNEVTGLSRSQLQGFVEVAGKSAEFILANPNGITCNGCGFINTPRVTLVTGRPDVVGGSVNGFDVSGGDFLLEGKGLDASAVDRFDLITRAARLNADIYARQLNIVTGRNRVDYKTGDVTALEGGDDGIAFQFALDASELGAMYANSIHLVGTEKGLGVNSEGLVQSVKDLEMDVNGDIRLKTVLANESIRISAHEGSVELGEKTYAAEVDIAAIGKIVNHGLLAAAETISLHASDIAQAGELYAGLNSDGSLNTDGTLQVNVENAFGNKGVLYVGNSFELQARVLDNSDGNISFGASSTFDLDGDLINREGTIHFRSEGGSIAANTIDNRGGTLGLTGVGSLELIARDSIDNEKGAISAQNRVSLTAEQFSNLEGAIVAREITFDVDSLDNRDGTVDARQLQINATTLTNHDGQLIARDETSRALTLDISKHLDNSDGFIYTSGQSLAIATDRLTNRDGVLSTADNTLLDIAVSDQLDNRGGSIQAAQIEIDAKELNNTEGTVAASSVSVIAKTVINDEGYLQGETVALTAEKYHSAGGVLLAFGSGGNVLDLNISQLIENTLEGIIQANSGNLTLAADTLNNRSGVINLKGKGVLSLEGRVDNTDGFISAAATLLITGQQLNNNRGEITADHLALGSRVFDNKDGLVYAGALSVNTGNLDNEAGKLIADQTLSLQLSTLNNQQGLVHTGGIGFTLQADSINNQGGTLSHAGIGQFLLSAGHIQNREGKITSDGSLQVTAEQFVNNYGFISALDSLTLTGSTLDNSSGKILSSENISIATETLDNHEGYIQGKGLTLNSDTLNNSAGALVVSGGGDLAVILTGALDNHGGTISGDGSVLLQATELNNDDGEISGNQLTLGFNTFSNRGGLVQGNELSLTVPELINTGGTIAAIAIDGAGLALSVNGLLENSGGLLLNRGQQFSVDAHTLINHDGEILHTGAGSLLLRAEALNNDLGRVQSNTDLSVRVQGITDVSNRSGTLSAVDHLIIDTLAGFGNTDGQLVAGESLTVSSKHLGNQNGLLSAVAVSLTADTIDNTGDGVIEAETLALHADTLTNSGTLLATGNIGQSLEFDINNFINTGRLESHGVDLLLNNINLHSDGGQIIHQGEGELRIVANGTFDNRDGTLATRGVLNFQADTIDNRAGQLIAGKQLDITIDAINNQGGLIQSGDGLSLVLQDFDNSQGGQVLIGGSTAARLNISRFFNNQDGSVIYQGDNNLTLNAGSFSNMDGVLGGSGSLDIIINDLFDNTNGQVIGEALVSITANELLNLGEGYLEADRLQLVVDQIINENIIFASGTLDESLVLTSSNIINRGLIESHGKDFNLFDAGLDNENGTVIHRGDGNFVIRQQTLSNDNGLIAGHGNVSLSVAELYNAAGETLSAKGLILSGELFENRGGILQADQLNILVNRIENTDDGWLIALGEETSAIVADQLTNNNSQIISNAGLTIETSTFDNVTGLLEADTLAVTAGQFNNSGIVNATSLNINANTLINRKSGELLAGYLYLDTDELDNLGLILAYGTSSAGLDIVARAVQNNGSIESHGNHLNLSSSQMLINSGDIYHQGNGTLLIESALLDNRQGAIAGSQLVLNSDTLDNRNGQIYAENQLTINALNVDNRTGVLQADQQLLLTTNSFDNREEGVLFAKQQAGLTLTSLDNRDGTITGKNFNIFADTLLNQSGEILVERLQLTGIDLDNTEGVIATTNQNDGSLVISVDNSFINQRGLIQTDGATASIHTGLLDNTGGDIFHLGGDALSLIANGLINNGGNLYSEHNLAITLADTLSNNDGNIFAGNWLDISAAHLLNQGGSLSSGEYLSLTLDTLINAGSQTDTDTEGLISARNVSLIVDSLDNLEGGRIQGNHLTITGAELTNNNIIASYAETDNAFVLAFEQIHNAGHLESSGENWRIDAGLLTNNGGVILHRGDGDLLLLIDQLINHNDGLIDAGNRLEVQAQTMDNTEGFIIARGESASLINADQLDNTGGYINASDLTISGMMLTNEKGEISGKNLSLLVNTITNFDGSMIADQLEIQANRLDNLKSGSGNSYIHATDLTINADFLNNQALIQAQQLTLAGDTLHNDNGEILALGETGQSLQLNFSQQITNRDGRLESWGSDLHIAGNLDNQDGRIILAGSGVLSLENLTGNASGEILSLGDLVITPDAIHQFVNNQLGILQAAGDITLTATDINNVDGDILAGNQLSITATTLDNTDGLLLSTGTGDNALVLKVSDVIDNTKGQIETHADNFALTSYNIINTGGEIRHLGEGTFSIHSDGNFTNDRGELGTMGNMDIRLDGAFINDGKLIAMKDLFIAATDISNLTSRLISAASIHFLADNTWNQGTTQSDSFRIDGGSLDNRAGILLVLGETDNSVTLNLDQFDNRDGGLLEIHGGNNTLTANILNDKGKITNLGEGTLAFSGLNNQGGRVLSTGDLAFTQSLLDNRDGVLQTAGNLTATIDELINWNGTLQAGQWLDIQARVVDNSQQGALLSGEGFRLTASESIINNGGRIETLADNMHIDTALLINEKGFLTHAGSGELVLAVEGDIHNDGGKIATEGNLSLDVDRIFNNRLDDQYALISAVNLAITSNELQNLGGYIQATEQLSFTLPLLNNQGGYILSGGTGDNALVLNVGSIDNRAGVMELHSNHITFDNIAFDNRDKGILNHLGNGLLTFSGSGDLQNSGGILQSAGELSIYQQSLDNRGGQINAATVEMVLGSALDNRDEGTVAGNRLKIQADNIDNRTGILAGLGNLDDALQLNVNHLDNSYGTLRSGADSWVLNLDSLINTGGSIFHTGNDQLTLTSDYLLTTSGTIASTGNLSIIAQGLENSGQLIADKNINLSSGADILNQTDAAIKAGQILTIDGAGDFINQGDAVALDGISLTLDGLLNNQGRLITDGLLATINVSNLVNTGTIAQNNIDGSLTLTAADITLNAGVVKADGSLVFNATDITNNAIISAGDFSAASFNQFHNNNGATTEAGSINFQGNSFLNDGTFIATNTDNSLLLNVSDVVNTKLLVSNSTNQSFMGSFTNSGEFRHAGSGVLTLGDAGSVNLQGGSVSTAGTANLSGTLTGAGNLFAETAININSSGTFNNLGSTLYTKGALTINSAVNNQAGKLLADGNLLIQTTGAVNNSNNGVIQGQALNINAGTINNTGGGSITSTGASAGGISAGYINNQGGKIASANQSFSIVSTSSGINNIGGSIQHTGSGTLTVNSRSDLRNSSNGKIITGGALNATISGLLSNSSGEITAGSFSISAATLNNNGGTINGLSGSANTSQITTGVLNNAGGSISANSRNLTIDASSVDNNSGSISHAGSGLLSIKAPSIFNNTQASSIRTNGALDLVTQGSFNNGGVISAVGNLVIKAITGNLSQVSNANKISSSSGEVSIVTSEKITNSGTIEGQQKVDLKTGELANTGTIKSVKEVSLDMDRLSLTGIILADELLRLKVKESVSVGSNEELSTQGSLVLITQGDITNAGKIAAEKSLELEGVNLFNNGNINGGAGQSKLTFTGNINNSHVITSDDQLNIAAGNYINNGRTAVANNLTLIAKNIDNTSGNVILSGGNMTLGASGSINNTNNSTILSIGNMVLEGTGGAGSKSQRLNNEDSRIESFGSMAIHSNLIDNKRNGVEYTAGQTVTSSTSSERSVGAGNHQGVNATIWVVKKTTTITTPHNVTANGPDAIIKSGGNMLLSGGNITNDYGTIFSGDRLTLNGFNLNLNAHVDKSAVTTITEEKTLYLRSGSPSEGGEVIHSQTTSTNTSSAQVPLNTNPVGTIRAENGISGTLAGQLEISLGSPGSSSPLPIDTGVSVDGSGGVSGSGVGSANGNQALVNSQSGSEQDTSGKNRQHNDRVDGGPVGADNTVVIDLTDPDVIDFLGSVDVQVSPEYLAGIGKENALVYSNGEFHIVNKSDVESYEQGILSFSDATVAVASEGSVKAYDAEAALLLAQDLSIDEIDSNTGDGVSGANGVVNDPLTLVSNNGSIKDIELSNALFGVVGSIIGSVGNTADKEIEGTAVDPESLTVSGNGDTGSTNAKQAEQKNSHSTGPEPLIIDLVSSDLNVDNLGGLYVTNDSPQGNYLVETRPEFTQYTNFLGSDYLLNALGHDPDKAIKRLGDAFYENQLIRDELSGKANTRFVSGATNDNEQMELLMNNAVAASGAMELSVGISLTSDQVAALTDDIVWLVEKTVNGEKVLVPTLYLASVDKNNLTHEHALIATGGNIDVHAAQGVNLKGKNVAGGSINFSTDQDFINAGDLSATLGVNLSAGNDLSNTGNISGSWIVANAENNLSTAGNMTAADILLESGNNFENFGNISGSNGIQINAGNTLTNHSTGSIISGGLLDMTATNDLINSQGHLEGYDVSLKSTEGSIINRTEFQQMTIGSSVRTIVGDNSTIISHNSLTMDAGKNLDLQGSTLKAQSDILLKAGNDILLNGVEDKSSSSWSIGNRSGANAKTEWDVVSLDAGGNLILSAGRDIAGQGAQLSAGNIASLTAGRDVNLAAVANSTHSEDIRSRKKVIDTTVTHTQANITSGSDTFIKAGQDINLIGANIDATGNVLLHAERDTNLVVVNDSEYHYDYTKQKKSFGRSKTTINETLSETAVGGAINSGGSVLINAQASDAGLLTLNSGNVNVIGGTITANNHVVISADEDINVVASTYNELDFHSTSKSGFGGLSKKAAGAVEEKTLLNRAGIEATSGNVNLLSGNNIALIAADVTAGGNINMEAVDQLLIGAGEAVSKSASWSKSSGLFSGGNIYSAKEAKAGESVTSGEGSVLNAGGRITGDSGSAKIIGSDLHGETGGVQLLTDIGSIEVLASKTTSQSYSYEKSMTVGLGDLVAGLSNPNDLIKNQDGRLTAKIADATYDEVDTKTNITSMTGSNITSGSGNIHLQSADSILIEGSNLQVGKDREGEREGDVNLVAVNNVTVREATDTLDTETKETHGKAELSVVVQHQAAEVVKAVIAVDEAKDQLEQAKKDYKSYERNLDQLEKQLQLLEGDYANKAPGVNYEDLLELRELVGDLKNDKEWYQAGVALAAVNLASATTALVQQTAAAANSTATWGFNAGLQLDIDASRTNSSYNETTAVASNLSGNNVRIQTGTIDDNGKLVSNGTATTIQGSHITADNKITVHTGELNILSSKNTTESQTETEHGHITAQITVYGAAGGASVSGSFDRSKGSDRSTTINNSTLDGKQIELVTTGDTNIRGGNVHATEHLYADIGGDLNLESQQNRSNSRNTSIGISGGVSFGGKAEGEQTVKDKLDSAQGKGNAYVNNTRDFSDVGGMAGVSGGLSAGNGMSVTRETVLSSLTSGGTATVSVAGNTQITGALLGTIDKDGNDLGQLTFSTGSLSFTDLRNTYQNTQTNIGLSTNLSVGETKTNPREGQTTAETTDGKTLYASTSNLAYSNTQENSASKTLATLGHGDITVGGVQLEKDGQLTDAGKATDSPLTSLNRDTANTEKTLWDSEQSQSIDATLDHRLLSKDGWSEIAGDVQATIDGIERGKNFISANTSSLDDELKGQVGTAGERAYYEARKSGMSDEEATAYLSAPKVADLMAKLSEAEQAIKNGQSEAGSDTVGQKTQLVIGAGSGSVLETVRVSDNAMEASGEQLALQTMGEASRYIEELRKTNPTEAAAIEFVINAASGGPIKAGIAKAVEQGLVVSGFADTLAQASSFVTETVSAKVVDLEYTRDELVDRIDNQKDDDLGKMTDGTGFFLGTVLGVPGSVKRNSDPLPDGYKKNSDGSITGPNDGRATPTEYPAANGTPIYERDSGGYYYIDDKGTQVAVESPKPKHDIGEKREHHNKVVDQNISDLKAQGYDVRAEVRVFDSCGASYCKPDIFYKNADGQVGFIEVKTGSAGLSSQQSSILKKVDDGYIVPPNSQVSPRLAAELGVDYKPGATLADIGYPNGIPVHLRYESGL